MSAVHVFFILVMFCGMAVGQHHPKLTLTKTEAENIRSGIDQAPLFKSNLADAKLALEKEIELGPQVPVPKDMAGGYTHERHKKNFFILYEAGNIYQITGEKKYAEFVRESLLAYAELFPTLPLHPTNKSYATGKIFWQCLNDANWLVYVSQAYDCVYNYLSEEERQSIEDDLLIPFADFISLENPKFFNRIHNHSTWGNAAVGMVGLVTGNEELIQRALYGIKDDGIDPNEVDNDGGYLKVDGVREAGFLAQLNHSFSPDGYFTEGPYYLRYALFPFLVFGRALENCKPELEIFEFRDGILQKAVLGLLTQADPQGRFFPVNDAQKGMSIGAREIITAVDVLYLYDDTMTDLLSIASRQNKVLLDGAGYKVAKDLNKNKGTELTVNSALFHDGSQGDIGGLAVLRKDQTCLAMKFSAQGMGHGHFDRLSYSLYDEGGEILQDYGAVRWVNIDQKGGGRYLKENQTFGKQTIAHNTIVINEISQYEGKVKTGEAGRPKIQSYQIKGDQAHFVSAKDATAYDGCELQRSMFILEDEDLKRPLVIDVFKVDSETEVQMDLPHWFMGHLLKTSFASPKALNEMRPLGDAHGYQHIWQEGSHQSDDEKYQLTWMGNGKIYTITGVKDSEDQLIFGRAGANDPEFNLRSDAVFIHRAERAKSKTFVNVLESHGTYSPVDEIPHQPYPSIESISVRFENDNYIVIDFGNELNTWTLAFAYNSSDKLKNHKVKINGESLEWRGPFNIFKK